MSARKILLVLALLMIVCFTNYAFAADWSSRLDGKPREFDPGHSKGYYIWEDKDGIHLRVTTPGRKHVFGGTITTNGNFEDVWGKSSGERDHFRVSEDRDKITYKFIVEEGSAGIDFSVSKGSYVKFNLLLDDDDVNPDYIFMGRDGWHPGSHKFELRRNDDPDKYDRDDKDRTVIIIGRPYWWHYPDHYPRHPHYRRW
jgi:hypothetical protein